MTQVVALDNVDLLPAQCDGLSYNTRVVLADGSTEKIGMIVNQRLPVMVMVINPVSAEITARWINGYYNHGLTKTWVKLDVEAAGGSGFRHITCTPDHLILTPSGELAAELLEEGGEVMVAIREYSLTVDQQQLILGSLLGDASLRRVGEHNFAFRVGHGRAQIDYVVWKRAMLAPFAGVMTGYGKGGAGRGFDTAPMQQLGALHAQADIAGGGRTISDEMLAQLDARAVAVWYGDDGNFSGYYARWGHGKSVIASKSLSRADKDRLADRLDELGMGRPTVRWNGLMFSGERTRLFQEAIAPYLPLAVNYKLHPRLRDRFIWQPRANDTTRAERTRLVAVPMRIARKCVVIAQPRLRTRFNLQIEGGHAYLADYVVVHSSTE